MEPNDSSNALTEEQVALFEFEPTPLSIEGEFERVPLQFIEVAPNNPRRQFSTTGIDRLAMALMCKGQLNPAIGYRPEGKQVLIYDGQRRVLAAARSHELLKDAPDSALKGVSHVLVHILDHEPSQAELRVIRAQANWSEQLSSADQQEQFQLCWDERIGMSEEDRMAHVCMDLGISIRKGAELRKQLRLPEEIRSRIATGAAKDGQITSRLASDLVPMFNASPQLAEAVADQVTSTELLRSALGDLSMFVHKTLLDRPDVYATRLEPGADISCELELARIRGAIERGGRHAEAAQVLGVNEGDLGGQLDNLEFQAGENRTHVQVTVDMRARVIGYGGAYELDRGAEFASGIWCCEPVLMLDILNEEIVKGPQHAGDKRGFFSAAQIASEDMASAAGDKSTLEQRKVAARLRNMELGQTVNAALVDPSNQLLHAVQKGLVELIASEYGDLLAFGAGWTNHDYQQPVGGTSRTEPKDQQVIVDQLVEKACADGDPLNGLAKMFSELAKAFVLDPEGLTATKALGYDRMEKRLSAVRSQAPGLAQAVWDMIGGSLKEEEKSVWRDQLIPGEDNSTVDLEAANAEISLDEIEESESDSQ